MPRSGRQDHEIFGKRIRKLRNRLGWSIMELSANVGMHSGYLSELERGKRNPSLETIYSLAAGLNVSAGYLVDGVPPTVPSDMEEFASIWINLDEEKRNALITLAALL